MQPPRCPFSVPGGVGPNPVLFQAGPGQFLEAIFPREDPEGSLGTTGARPSGTQKEMKFGLGYTKMEKQ